MVLPFCFCFVFCLHYFSQLKICKALLNHWETALYKYIVIVLSIQTAENALTVMLRLSDRAAYLLLVPQGRVLIGGRALISFLRNNVNVLNKTLIQYEPPLIGPLRVL